MFASPTTNIVAATTMAPTLGKRKRVSRAELEQASRSPSPSSESNGSGAENLQAIFRRAFEAKFKPLPVETKKPKLEEAQIEYENEDEEEESDWSGISDDESTNQVEVIELKDTRHARDETEKAEKKAFMTSKPPSSTSSSLAPTKSTVKKPQEDDNDPTDKTNLKNDLALQKLLRDSHILSTSSSGTSTPTLTTSLSATGSQRHKSTDLHLLTLGAKSSVFTQKNMPMAQRKHELAKKRGMEEKRRARAKEAGIVLEVQRSSSEKKGKGKGVGERRERGVGGPSVGRFKGGTLSLSREDVRSITGGGGGGGRGGKGGKGGKGKGRTGKR